MPSYFKQALAAGYARLEETPKGERVTYVAADRSEYYRDPEEKVRAEFWAELIFRYQYPPERLGVEITVPDRTPKDAADIVVFSDDARTRPYAVIECKRDGISDAEFGQAVEQAAGNGTWAKLRALYVGVVAGDTRRFLDFSDEYGALERERNIIADLPMRYGKPQEYKFVKGGPLDIAAVSREQLISAIRKSHQTLWAGGKLSPPAAFGELCKIIFVKISDEQAKRRVGEPYEFQIKTHEDATGLATRIRKLYQRQQEKDPDVFTDTIKVDDVALRTIVSHLESLNLSATDLDTKGVAFEQFMDSFFKGDFGQFFTPRPVIEFAVSMLRPTSDDLVLDPACGSGGFLLYALDAIRREASEYHDIDSADFYRHWHDFASKKLYGIEVNEELTRVAKMNMIIHDDGHSNVVGWDALESVEALSRLHPGFKADSFDVILTNPPFGATIKVSDKPYLATFELGNKVTKTKTATKVEPRKQQKTEILFLERIKTYLKPGAGRAAVVLPDGIFANSSLAYVRSFIVDNFQVLAVVSLPATAFSHYGAAVKSSILFLRRRAQGETPRLEE